MPSTNLASCATPPIILNQPQITLNPQQLTAINAELSIGSQVCVLNTGASNIIQVARSSPWATTTAFISTTSSWSDSVYWTTSTSTTLATSTLTWPNVYWQTIYSELPTQKPYGPHIVKKSVKSSLKRALKLMSTFGMGEDVKIFLGGSEIEVSHPDSQFKFVLSRSKYSTLLQGTEFPSHAIPYNLDLYTKSNVHVASLCVVMDGTPVLDQILALAMFVKSGNEQALLEKANFRSLCSDIELRNSLSLDSPMLQKKLRTDSRVIQHH